MARFVSRREVLIQGIFYVFIVTKLPSISTAFMNLNEALDFFSPRLICVKWIKNSCKHLAFAGHDCMLIAS